MTIGAASSFLGGRREAIPAGGSRRDRARIRKSAERLDGANFLMDWPADDQPLWMKTRSGPIMSVPYPIEINDSPQILVRHPACS
jgi:hypothetical protein